jgi:DHA2 family lincomycin resistance protein-like MFS transporter
MSIAIPVLQVELGVPPSVGQWLTTAFMLTMAVVIPLTGFLIQRIQTRTLYVAAMSLFTAGTVLAFTAQTFDVLLAARVVQASGTAIMLPLLMTTIMTVVPPEKRGAMMGNVTIVISVAPALGPTLSGLILDHFDWRWIFGFVAPVAAVALVLGARRVVSVSAPTSSRVDLLSVPLSALGFGGLVYGLVGIGESAGGGSGVPTWVPFVVGGVSLAAFLLRQRRLQRVDGALLDLRVFGSSQFALATVAMVVAMVVMLGTFILLPYFAQQVLGYGPFATGLITLPGGLVMGLSGPIVGRIYDAQGPRVLLVPGSILVSAGVWMLAGVDASTPMWWLLFSNVVIMLGLSATFTPIMTGAMGSVEPQLYSHASAVIGTFQQVAGAAGTALFVTVMTVVAAGATEQGAGPVDAVTDGVQMAFLIGGLLSLLLIPIAAAVRAPDPVEAPHG